VESDLEPEVVTSCLRMADYLGTPVGQIVGPPRRRRRAADVVDLLTECDATLAALTDPAAVRD
jgi:hypothetical protein